jgi:hypothetical protein
LQLQCQSINARDSDELELCYLFLPFMEHKSGRFSGTGTRLAGLTYVWLSIFDLCRRVAAVGIDMPQCIDEDFQ